MITEFSLDDLESCVALFVQVFNGEPWRDKWTDETARVYLRELIDHRRFVGFTLWDGQTLAGAVLGHLKSHYKGDELFIDELFIHPDGQRRGHGTALMDTTEQFSREHFLVSITLLTGKEKPSFRFFEKCGYRHLPYLAFMHKRLA